MNSILRRAMLSGLCAGLLLCLCACSADYSRAYERALSTFASGEYADAAEAFDRLGDYANAAAYAAYSHGLVFYGQGQYAEAEPCFAQSRDLLYGEERYQYCHAHALADEGRFAEAADDYTDTAVRVGRLSALLNPATSVVMNFGILAILWLGGAQVQRGILSQGVVIAFISYVTQIALQIVVAGQPAIQCRPLFFVCSCLLIFHCRLQIHCL